MTKDELTEIAKALGLKQQSDYWRSYGCGGIWTSDLHALALVAVAYGKSNGDKPEELA